MNLKFKTQQFQTDAVDAVCDLFSGQEKSHTTFSIVEEQQISMIQSQFGVGNALLIDDDALLSNMHDIQRRNKLPLTTDGFASKGESKEESRTFCVEMDTGAGKTYVYTKTIFELNKRFGFTKFIIVVPSVAIREGVYKSLQVTADHFGAHYDNVPCRYFIYDSKKLSDVRRFATSSHIEIMIINIDVFKKAENIINQAQDKLNGETVMRYIQDTNPVVIIDESQSVDNATKFKEAIASLNPLCTLCYSATHREKMNLLYRLTPVDTYQMGLVKQIFVSSNTEYIKLGKTIGSVDENLLKRTQIRRTIEAHFDKELRYLEKEIKVLSLFFIDEVTKYRTVDGDKGIYAQMFEECYLELLERPKYAELRKRFAADAELVHNGYFSQDKKSVYKNTKGNTLADNDTYNTIMRDKEWLLSFECPLRFIFSHSALKEGWDNPNVFQVCTLIEQKSTFTCRQKIGCGLRLCVDQQGNRIEDRDTNILHVMVNESFAEFDDALQREIEQETGVKFGVLQLNLFVGQTYEEIKTVEKTLTSEQAAQVVETLKQSGVLDDGGDVKAMPHEIEDNNLLSKIHEVVKNVVTSTVEKAYYDDVPVAVENLSGSLYTETVTEEKTISYEEGTALMTELTDKKLVTKDGKIKDTMKAQMVAGTLDLDVRFSQAAQKAIIRTIEKQIRDRPFGMLPVK